MQRDRRSTRRLVEVVETPRRGPRIAADTKAPCTGEALAPIFVVGAPRSGTTLLERLLDAHFEIAIADEIILVLALRRHVPELDTRERRAAFFALLPQLDHVRFWRGVEAVLEQIRQDLEKVSTAASDRLFSVQLLKRDAKSRGRRRFGEQTPWNVRHLSTIRDWFPDARILHIVRDPRAQVASRRRLPRTSRDVLTNALKWRIDVDLGRMSLARWPRPRTSPKCAMKICSNTLNVSWRASVRGLACGLSPRCSSSTNATS